MSKFRKQSEQVTKFMQTFRRVTKHLPKQLQPATRRKNTFTTSQQNFAYKSDMKGNQIVCQDRDQNKGHVVKITIQTLGPLFLNDPALKCFRRVDTYKTEYISVLRTIWLYYYQQGAVLNKTQPSKHRSGRECFNEFTYPVPVASRIPPLQKITNSIWHCQPGKGFRILT